MIRTETVKLSSIAGLAYRQKLTAGGAGLAILTQNERAAYTIDKRNSNALPYGPVNGEIFTSAVVGEALELTRGLSYKKLGTVTKIYDDCHFDEAAFDPETEEDKPSVDVIGSKEYEGFIMEYTDKNGKFSYQVMNRDLMKFADSSSVVGNMVANHEKDDEIVRYVVRSKAVGLSGAKAMDDGFLTAFIDVFDSMNTRSAFKELKSHIRAKMSSRKR